MIVYQGIYLSNEKFLSFIHLEAKNYANQMQVRVITLMSKIEYLTQPIETKFIVSGKLGLKETSISAAKYTQQYYKKLIKK